MQDNSKNYQDRQDQEALNLKEIVEQFVRALPERSGKIVTQRYGLDGSKKRTLEQIGQDYDITRERVRQIEAASLKEAKKSEKAIFLVPAEELIESILHEHGKIMEHQSLVEKAQEVTHEDTHDNHIEFVLHVSDRFNDHKENENLKKGWYLDEADLGLPQKLVESFVNVLEEKNEPIPQDKVLDYLIKNEIYKEAENLISDSERLIYLLHLSKKIQKNPYGEWGLSHWNEIAPKGVKDKAYVVLKKEGRPLHFTEITDKINESGFSRKTAVPQTVHNELIKDERFVLVGRGIYALVKWGYKPGTVADVVIDVLKSSDKPLSKNEIIDEVLKQRLVKKNTIVLALQNKDKIKKQGDQYLFITE